MIKPGTTPAIPSPPRSAPKDRYLTREEATALLAAAQSGPTLTRAYRWLAIALATSKRKRAIENLRWFDVDFDKGVIHFRRQDDRDETSKRLGSVPISDWLRPILRRAFAEKTSEWVLDHPGDTRKVFDTARRRAGLPWVTHHTCRHTWATWAAQVGVSMWEISGVMGCSVATATRNYMHHAPEHLRAAVNSAGIAAKPVETSEKVGTSDQQ